MGTPGLLTLDRRGPVALVTMQRPAVLNALSPALLTELIRGLAELSEDPEVRAIVLTGAGRAFMSGADVREMSAMSTEQFRTFIEGIQELTRVIRSSPAAVLAAINGPAVGGGCEIACACDLRIASADATFSFPETRLGLVVTSGVSYLLPRIVGSGWATHLLLTAETISADEARRIGLVDEVVPTADLVSASTVIAERVAEHDRLAVGLTKRLLQAGEGGSLEGALGYEVEAALSCLSQGSARERLEVFIRRREASVPGGEKS